MIGLYADDNWSLNAWMKMKYARGDAMTVAPSVMDEDKRDAPFDRGKHRFLDSSPYGLRPQVLFLFP